MEKWNDKQLNVRSKKDAEMKLRYIITAWELLREERVAKASH